MKPIFKYLCIPALITLPVSSACADDDTDLFINKVINIYQHPDRNLVITWTDDSNKSPSDGSPIRNADVSAKNITITSDFLGNRWTDKGIISEYSTNVNTSEDINITTNDDGVFTEGNGNININGFKNLNITSRAGFGVVDNGDGITITGGNNSVVSITSEEGNMGVPFWGQIWPIPNAAPAIGSSTRENNLGKGISISAGEIELNSTGNYSIQARYGKNGRFEVNLDASEIDITGTIYGAGGNITITPRTAGVMKISPSDKAEDETLKNNSILLTNGSTLTINKDSAELKQMQITGKINVAGEGTSLRANMTGDSSIKGSSSTVAIEASNGGSVELHMSGVNSSITGDVNAITGTGSSIFLNIS